MKNIFTIVILFVLTYFVIQTIGGFLFTADSSGSALQSAVTFGGINFLAIFIYTIFATIATTIIFFTLKNRRSD